MSKHEDIRYSLANAFELPAFVTTLQVQRVHDFCEAVRKTHTVGLLTGMPGVGKTWAAQHKAQIEPEPEDFRTSPVLYTSADARAGIRGVLVDLLNCLGPDYRAPIGDMTRLVCCWIHRRMTELIIIDNAQWLDKASLELLCNIHERTRCAITLVGPPELPKKMNRYREIQNRVSIILEMLPLTYDELFEFLQQWFLLYNDFPPGTGMDSRHYNLECRHQPDIVKEVYRVTLGNLRRVRQFMDQAARVTMVNEHYWIELETAQVVAVLMSTGRL